VGVSEQQGERQAGRERTLEARQRQLSSDEVQVDSGLDLGEHRRQRTEGWACAELLV
jgi:hypothetical protein